MANALFAGSSPIDESSLITRKTSRANSAAYYQRTSHDASVSISHVSPMVHAPFLAEAIAEARTSLGEGGIPIGCVLVRNGQIVARGHNRRLQQNSTILHAEIDCLEAAGRQPASFYRECTLYTTLSPNAFSSGAIHFYGIPRVVIGDNKTYSGDESSLRTNHIQVDHLDSHACEELLTDYIKNNENHWQENILRDEH